MPSMIVPHQHSIPIWMLKQTCLWQWKHVMMIDLNSNLFFVPKGNCLERIVESWNRGTILVNVLVLWYQPKMTIKLQDNVDKFNQHYRNCVERRW